MGMTLDHQPLAAFRWDKQGRECERRQGNGLVNRYQYDPLGQLIAHQRYHGYDISTQTSPTPIWQQQYHYNPNGQLAEITGHQPRRYRYDNAGQLHTVTYPEVNPKQHHAEKVEQFDYDQIYLYYFDKLNEKALKLLQNNQQPLMGTDGILTP
ncbi:RHS repeat domain-containing protein [Gilliamella sp. Fer4-1]|uniref:RHS repeat domain-containing protein n=1 Tax=Gilliamella sp. Fer4-1 TaxID=3120242 RepID=UPI00080E8E1D|nr:RHS repeat domain-containing protein [Gilliamella apicola]OCG65045.1 hypothetical protein A9G30_06980 [Gilliamella apicola]